MKYLLAATVLACMAFVCLEGAIAPQGINDKIVKLLEKLKKEMPCGFPEEGIPPLAPFKKEYSEWTYQNILFSILASIVDFRVDGLNKYITHEAKFSTLTLKSSFDISFKGINMKGQYVNNLVLLKLLKLAGKGDLDILLQDLRLKGKMQFAAKGKGLYIKDFEVVVVLGDVRLDISGILGGGIFKKLFNRTFEKIMMLFVKYQSKLVGELIHDIVVPIGNEYLKDLTVLDLLDIINSADDPVKCVLPENPFLYKI